MNALTAPVRPQPGDPGFRRAFLAFAVREPSFYVMGGLLAMVLLTATHIVS